MMAGQHVVRGDGTRWQVAGIRTSWRTHRHGHTVPPVATTTYRLVRGDQVVDVEVWGHGAAVEIGAMSEVLVPSPAELGAAS